MDIDLIALKQSLLVREIKQCEFAKACDLSPSVVSAILNGWQSVGKKTANKLRAGLKKLKIKTTEIIQTAEDSDEEFQPPMFM